MGSMHAKLTITAFEKAHTVNSGSCSSFLFDPELKNNSTMKIKRRNKLCNALQTVKDFQFYIACIISNKM